MATIQEELNYLEETKGLIKNAIINKGQDITDQDSFRSYVNKIDNISTVNLQSKTIDPTTNQQIIIPDQPNYNGLSSVTINAVTSNIDNNITVENIRSGVSILGVTGNYSGIDTSDADATVEDLAEGVTAYVNGVKLTGMANTGTMNIADYIYITDYDINTISVSGKTSGSDVSHLIYPNSSQIIMHVLKEDMATYANLTPEILKQGVNILGVVGNLSEGIDTSDATATADDIVTVHHLSHGEGYYIPKTAYVNGNKINGNIRETRSINGQIPESPTIARVENISNIGTWTNYIVFNTTIQSNYSYVVNNTSLLRISVLNTALTNVFNITSDKLLNGYTLFGVTGNYSGGIKEYANTTTMNNDISNISIDEVVKVLSGPNYFIKELVSNIPTMTELVKESETISPQEYEENIELVNDILGEEE